MLNQIDFKFKLSVITLSLFIFASSSVVVADTKNPNKYIYKIIEFKTTVSIDTVANVLNYSDGGPDDGNESTFWYAVDAKKCIYAKASNSVGVKSEDGLTTTFEVIPKLRVMDLNSFDRTSLKFASEKINYPSVFGEAPRTTTQVYIYADGREIFRTEGIDIERVKKGWNVIYSKYCAGTKKEF
jgi:hypothetical protein